MRRTLASLVLLALGACTGAPAEPEPEPGVWTPQELRQLASLRLDATPRPAPTNRWADDPQAARLGQALFFDDWLGQTKVGCVQCHEPRLGFADGKVRSVGMDQTARHAPAIPGSQYGPWLFWDGRADSLWSQAAGPIEHPDEMGSSRTAVAQRVATHHRQAYAQVFGEPPDLSDRERFNMWARPTAEPGSAAARHWEQMTPEDREAVMQVFVNSLKAIAAYERLLVPTESDFDRYVDAVTAGDPTGGGHLSPAQVRGLSLFLREGNCTACHSGPMLTDRAFHNLGLPLAGSYDAGRTVGAAQVLESEFSCRSRWSDATDCPELDYLDPSFPDFQQAFKTPTLRNVARTAPYMHHGALADLDAVLTFYSELPGDPAANHRELTLQPLNLTPAQKSDLIAFLNALTGDPLPAELLQAPPAPDAEPADDGDGG